jgi:NAD-dependent DNA ligase
MNISSLVKRLSDAAVAYYETSEPIMSDMEYDSLVDQLKALGDATRAARKNTPEASGTARKAPSGGS